MNKERFVTISQTYTDTNSPVAKFNIKAMTYQRPDCMVIDSLVYIVKKDSTQKVTDYEIRNIISEDMELKKYQKSVVKLYEAKQFIVKDWDYGLKEDFPEEIQMKSNNYSISSSESKTKIFQLSLFKLLAAMTPEFIEIRALKDVNSSKNDKVEDKMKKGNQMEME